MSMHLGVQTPCHRIVRECVRGCRVLLGQATVRTQRRVCHLTAGERVSKAEGVPA